MCYYREVGDRCREKGGDQCPAGPTPGVVTRDMDLAFWINKLVMISLVFTPSYPGVVSARFNSPSVIDLMQHVAGNISGQAMKRIPGLNGHSTAHYFQGSSRQIEVTHRTVARVRHLLEDSGEFTLVTAFKQQEKTSGSIFSFTSHDTRYFELESSGRRDELRLHYFRSGRLRTETFPYKLADNQWHTVALGFSRDYIEVFIDCKKVYERTIGWLEWSWNSRRMSIFIGQRGEASHAYFKGAIEYIALIDEPNGVLHICPHANIACPTCSQFRQIQHSIDKLYEHIKVLNDKLLMAEQRITELEQCECQLSCTVNGTHHKNEDVWDPDPCTKCICKNGIVDCQTEPCPQLNCKHPVRIPGVCCPICRRQCFVHGNRYDDGETFRPEDLSSHLSCVKCTCNDGSSHCDRIVCEPPPCPEEDQFEAPGECCRMCNGTDFCQRGHDCHDNATCYNFETQYKCECNPGFGGDGKHCEDIDECRTAGGMLGHYCSKDAKCINTIGSYRCECEPGFILKNNLCEEHDECATDSHSCDPNAQCINAHGGYRCECMLGYEGDGFTCKAQCRDECRNGGVCVSPNVCQCRKGFFGRSCRDELDECQLQMDQCHENSECVNVPGSYYCQCKQGFYSNSADNQNGAACKDINECSGWGGGHTCPEGTLCRNTPGGYECACISPALCGGCSDGGQWHMNGTSWRPGNSSCITLSCINGHIRSRQIQCDCKDPDVDRKCCAHCPDEGQCRHHGKRYPNGHQWVHQCQQCQCLDAEIDCWPMECPRLSCKTVILEGDCCPRCEEDKDPCHEILDPEPQGIIRELTESCDFNRSTYSNGRTWTLASDQCTTCECKGGHVCCQYKQYCRRRKNSRKRMRNLNVRRGSHHGSRNRNSDRSQRMRHDRNRG